MTKNTTIAEKQAKIKELEAEILAELPAIGEIIQAKIYAYMHEIENEFNVSIDIDQILFYHNDQAKEAHDYFLNFDYQS